jgi:hypothetical protein
MVLKRSQAAHILLPETLAPSGVRLIVPAQNSLLVTFHPLALFYHLYTAPLLSGTSGWIVCICVVCGPLL